MMALGPGGKALPFNEISGILNASIARSLELQRSRRATMQSAIFDVIRHQGVDVQGLPREQRVKLLADIMRKLPREFFTAPATAVTQDDKVRLVERIRAGEVPETREGVVMHMPGGSVWKYKERPETTAYVAGTYPGEGRRSNSVGGVLISLEPGGKPIGHLGTGFTEAELRDIAKAPGEYMGRPVRIMHQGQFDRGTFRAPSFGGWETDGAAANKAAAITLDIEKGDVLLGGRFKNVPHVVETIGTDALGQPTVNGMKLLSFRIKKLMKSAASYGDIPLAMSALVALVQSSRAGKKMNREWRNQPAPGLFLPAPPPRTERIVSIFHLERYLKKNVDNPTKRDVILRAAKGILTNKRHNAFFFAPDARGTRPSAVVASRLAPAKAFSHEYGHARDYNQQIKQHGRADLGGGGLKTILLAPLVGAKRTPLYRKEQTAWELSGVDEHDPLRQAALNTYASSIKMPEYVGRYGIPGALGVRYLERHPEKLRAALKLLKRGQATNALINLVTPKPAKPVTPKPAKPVPPGPKKMVGTVAIKGGAVQVSLSPEQPAVRPPPPKEPTLQPFPISTPASSPPAAPVAPPNLQAAPVPGNPSTVQPITESTVDASVPNSTGWKIAPSAPKIKTKKAPTIGVKNGSVYIRAAL